MPELATLRTSTLGAVTTPTALPTTLVASGAVAADIELLFALDADAGFGVTVTVLGGAAAVELSVVAGGGNATIALTGGCRGGFLLPAGLKEIALRLLVDGSVRAPLYIYIFGLYSDLPFASSSVRWAVCPSRGSSLSYADWSSLPDVMPK